jgi:hypothetical protein
MEFPHHHHHHGHRRDDDDDERRGPPPPAYGGYGQPDPYGRPPADDPYGRVPPPSAYGAGGDPYGRHPPAPSYGRAEEGYGAPPPAYSAGGAGGYGNVVHVGHEVGGERPHYGVGGGAYGGGGSEYGHEGRPHHGGGGYGGGGSEYGHETRPHHGGGGAPPVRQQTYRIYCKAGEDHYSLASRDGKVCLVRTDRDDDTQVRITHCSLCVCRSIFILPLGIDRLMSTRPDLDGFFQIRVLISGSGRRLPVFLVNLASSLMRSCCLVLFFMGIGEDE